MTDQTDAQRREMLGRILKNGNKGSWGESLMHAFGLGGKGPSATAQALHEVAPGLASDLTILYDTPGNLGTSLRNAFQGGVSNLPHTAPAAMEDIIRAGSAEGRTFGRLGHVAGGGVKDILLTAMGIGAPIAKAVESVGASSGDLKAGNTNPHLPDVLSLLTKKAEYKPVQTDSGSDQMMYPTKQDERRQQTYRDTVNAMDQDARFQHIMKGFLLPYENGPTDLAGDTGGFTNLGLNFRYDAPQLKALGITNDQQLHDDLTNRMAESIYYNKHYHNIGAASPDVSDRDAAELVNSSVVSGTPTTRHEQELNRLLNGGYVRNQPTERLQERARQAYRDRMGNLARFEEGDNYPVSASVRAMGWPPDQPASSVPPAEIVSPDRVVLSKAPQEATQLEALNPYHGLDSSYGLTPDQQRYAVKSGDDLQWNQAQAPSVLHGGRAIDVSTMGAHAAARALHRAFNHVGDYVQGGVAGALSGSAMPGPQPLQAPAIVPQRPDIQPMPAPNTQSRNVPQMAPRVEPQNLPDGVIWDGYRYTDPQTGRKWDGDGNPQP